MGGVPASKPGTEVPTNSSYGSEGVGVGSQAGAYIVHTTNGGRTLVVAEADRTGVDGAISSSCPRMPIMAGSTPSGTTAATTPATARRGRSATAPTSPWCRSLDTFSRTWSNGSWGPVTRLSTVTSNPDWEQFSNRTVPFWGDYIDVSTINGHTVGVWTDSRDVVAGIDPREGDEEDNDNADVKQCRTLDPSTGLWSGDLCPHAGGLDQNIYGRIIN